MFKNTYQSGFISILYAGGSRPLAIWSQTVRNGHIRRVTDEDVQTLALEIMGTNVATTYIICPADRKSTLGIRLPFFVMIVKNMKKYFTFEIQILDDKNMSRRFRVSNYQSTTRVRPFNTSLPIGLNGGWNQIQFNLADFTRRAYGSSYLETMRVQIHANVRIRRIYFSDRLYAEDEMPQEFKLYVPIAAQKKDRFARVSKEKEKAVLEDKSTGRDAPLRASVTFQPEGVIPSGAPPTPLDTAREEIPPEELPKTVETVEAEEKHVVSETPTEEGMEGEEPEMIEPVTPDIGASEGEDTYEAVGSEAEIENREDITPYEPASEESPSEEGEIDGAEEAEAA